MTKYFYGRRNICAALEAEAMAHRYAEMLEQAKLHVAEGRLGKESSYGSFPRDPIAVYLRHIKPEVTAEDLFSGYYWNFRYAAVADYYGYPSWVAGFHNAIFAGLPADECFHWHIQIAETIAAYGESTDWRKALHRAHIGLLSIAREVISQAQGDAAVQDDDVAQNVTRVAALHKAAFRGEPIDQEEWNAGALAG